MYTLLVAVTVAVIVFFLPRNSGPQFRYDIGKPWMYSPLIAKFDFGGAGQYGQYIRTVLQL